MPVCEWNGLWIGTNSRAEISFFRVEDHASHAPITFRLRTFSLRDDRPAEPINNIIVKILRNQTLGRMLGSGVYPFEHGEILALTAGLRRQTWDPFEHTGTELRPLKNPPFGDQWQQLFRQGAPVHWPEAPAVPCPTDR